jgi:hypothetical protein
MPTPDELRIGDFSKPVATRAPKVTESPAKQNLEAVESRLDTEAAQDEAALKPLQSYEDKLKEVGLTKSDAAKILDDVMMRGHYAEDVQVTPRFRARLRTRNARDTRRAQEILETQRLTYDSHYAESLSRILLASSLEVFGDERLPHPERRAPVAEVEDAFNNRMRFVESMPDPALRMMFKQLMNFDKKVAVALEEGAVENF